ncbi:hypothetical protein ABZ319_04015 [Nocardia sp. NPDC005978]|uniref:hypothetical protein n=1 Tax=Nocardia sp. NPDC005978 TaxID=3156725 RepID=UPI0033B2829A
MDLRTPMQLSRDQELVALITRYGYETPWATGLVEDFDLERGERSERVARYLQWFWNEDDLPEDDAAYAEVCSAELARHDVTQSDVDWCTGGDWTIQTRDGITHRVYSLDFIADRTVQWRW